MIFVKSYKAGIAKDKLCPEMYMKMRTDANANAYFATNSVLDDFLLWSRNVRNIYVADVIYVTDVLKVL